MPVVFCSRESYHFFRKNFASELSEDLNVRLIYNGRELKEGNRLSTYGLAEGCTIHCLVTSRNRLANAATANRDGAESDGSDHGGENWERERDISRLVFPVFGVFVGVIWYCRVAYKQYFNVISTFGLLGITVLFLAASFTLWSSTTAPGVARDLPAGNGAVRVVRYRSD